jgi:hypothetical protein
MAAMDSVAMMLLLGKAGTFRFLMSRSWQPLSTRLAAKLRQSSRTVSSQASLAAEMEYISIRGTCQLQYKIESLIDRILTRNDAEYIDSARVFPIATYLCHRVGQTSALDQSQSQTRRHSILYYLGLSRKNLPFSSMHEQA